MRQYSFSLSLSLFRTHNGGHTNPRFTFPVACSLKSSPLSLVHPITAKNTRCAVECKCGKCFLELVKILKKRRREEFFAKCGAIAKKGKNQSCVKKTLHPFTPNIPSISNKAARRRRRRRRRTRERGRERTKENLCDGYAAILLRILRRVPHARFRDRSKTTHFRI